MALFTFFPKPKQREFNYKPRYYDPEKDRLEQLKKKYDPQTPEEQRLAEAKVRIHEVFQRKPKPKGVLSKRLLVIFILLVIVLLFWISK